MKYNFMVKHNGIWYEVGEEVPTSDNTVKAKVEEITNESSTKYKRADIQKMKVEELKKVATEIGIKFDDEVSGSQLKKDIIIKLGI